MKHFSERKGLKKPRTEIQVDSMDVVLKNRLWNCLEIYWELINGFNYVSHVPELHTLFTRLWHNYFKEPIDTMPTAWDSLIAYIRKYFFRSEWNEVYDFVEFIANYYSDEGVNQRFIKACNTVLQQELSAYRFVGVLITEVTSKEEISEIEEALTSPFEVVNAHVANALKLMSDKKAPDFRNSIKESISAVEAICRLVTGKKNATLGDALDIIEKEGKIELHGAIKKAFDSLYGYTSSAEGIRHALTEEKVNVTFEDAKFMMVSCSAFVNFLISKSSKVGIKLSQLKRG